MSLCNIKTVWFCWKTVPRLSLGNEAHLFCLFLYGNSGLVGNPVHEVGYGGEARRLSHGAPTECAVAEDAQADEVVSLSDGQRTAIVTLGIQKFNVMDCVEAV